MADDLGDDLQVSLKVQSLELWFEQEWPMMYQQLELHRFEKPRIAGPSVAAKLAGPMFEPTPGTSCAPGSAGREAVLVSVAGIVLWSELAADPFGSKSKFFGYAFSNLARSLGFVEPPQLMSASLHYVPDLADGDLYRIALRASRQLDDRLDLAQPLLSAMLGSRVWPTFFSNLTLKKAWL